MDTTPTLYTRIQRWAAERPAAGALYAMNASGEWDVITWADYDRRVRRIARALIGLGVKPGDSVSLIAKNRPEWVLVQHGIAAAGAIPCPIYVTNLPEQVAYIVDHSESRILFLDEAVQLDKVEWAEREGKATVDHIITFGDLGRDNPKITPLADLEAKADDTPDSQLEDRLSAVKPDDVTLRIYTSGTTGLPKGAEVSHRGIETVVDGVMSRYREQLAGDQRIVSYLPLCHVAEQIFTNFLGLEMGGECYFCPELPQLKDHLVKAKPTCLLGVPRVWEKFEAALRDQLGQATGLRASLASWALATERKAREKEIATGQPQGGIGRAIARRLVISKIQRAIGIDEVRLACTGAAPISQSTLEFFLSIGLIIHEAYGMTETTGVATVQPPLRPRFGTVGQALPGVEIRIAEDQEILLKGANMVSGYHKLPEKTAELYTDEWLHTGDLGSLDAEGFLSITGRKKDLLITAGGKNVAPAEMEGHLMAIPGVGHAVTVGDRKPYLSALLALDPEGIGTLLKAAGIEDQLSAEEAAKDERVLAYLKDQVEEQCNRRVARYQQIKYFEVLPHPFTVDTGELTPTMKIKRNVVAEKYADVIEGMYAGKAARKAAPASAS